MFGDVRKLKHRFTGPYVVKEKVHENAYALEGLPSEVPPTQNVSFLRMFYPSPKRFESRPTPGTAAPPVTVNSHYEWEVEAIVGHRPAQRAMQYLLKWRDHDKKTWVRVPQMKNCADMLREYQKEHNLVLDYWDSSSSSPESDTSESEENSETSKDRQEKSVSDPNLSATTPAAITDPQPDQVPLPRTTSSTSSNVSTRLPPDQLAVTPTMVPRSKPNPKGVGLRTRSHTTPLLPTNQQLLSSQGVQPFDW